jgi:hypothetical protein
MQSVGLASSKRIPRAERLSSDMSGKSLYPPILKPLFQNDASQIRVRLEQAEHVEFVTKNLANERSAGGLRLWPLSSIT